ncbi:hypothetical protein ACWIUD_09800 [Helicobacter sp. 23-1044]
MQIATRHGRKSPLSLCRFTKNYESNTAIRRICERSEATNTSIEILRIAESRAIFSSLRVLAKGKGEAIQKNCYCDKSRV